ncbi:sensor histidine kinase [Streptomyces nigrescens]|uniref:sensor histidine kinase n=1 Tax=Streptomyces nigrescens TaxID=1920 RepID=UPI003702C085
MSVTPPPPLPVPAPTPTVEDPSAVAAAAAHQVRGPLSSIQLRLELLRDRLPGPPNASARQEIQDILREMERLSEILGQVLAWGAVDHSSGPVETVDVLGVAATRVDAWAAQACVRGVRLCLDGVAVTGTQVRGSLEQALDVFLENALHAAPEGSDICVTVYATPSLVRAEVRDQGPGMPDEEIARACEPFWRGTAGRNREGTGLGLTVAAALLAASGGHLELGRAPTGGLRAIAVLPVAD